VSAVLVKLFRLRAMADVLLATVSVVFYLSKWYTRTEIASRIAIFYAGAVIASAFGGLLAYAMFHIRASGNLFDWSYLFILEGSLTCLLAIAAYFILPADIGRAYFLNHEEKVMAERRLEIESMQSHSEKFVWSQAVSEFRTIHGWARVIIAFSVGILPNASANFLAIMTQRLGYSVTKTNLVSGILPQCRPRSSTDTDFHSTRWHQPQRRRSSFWHCLFLRTTSENGAFT
jgi:MFS family permease